MILKSLPVSLREEISNAPPPMQRLHAIGRLKLRKAWESRCFYAPGVLPFTDMFGYHLNFKSILAHFNQLSQLAALCAAG
jgi:hypothetical protein